MKHSMLLAVMSIVVVTFTLQAAAQPGPPGTPIKAGNATFTFNGAALAYQSASGTANMSYGFHTVSLTFAKDAKPGGDHLNINLMVQTPGKVDLNAPFGNGIGMWSHGKIYSYEKGKSACTVALTKVTETEVEGTADCPTLNEMNGSGTAALRNVKFSARTN